MIRTRCSTPIFIFNFLTCVVLVLCNESNLKNQINDDNKDLIYHNQFAVHIPGGIEAANEIASKYGFNNIGQVRLST